MKSLTLLVAAAVIAVGSLAISSFRTPEKVVKVFLLAGQSNAEGADTSAAAVDDYPPFVGAAEPQADVLYAYHVGSSKSDGWTELQPVDGRFGAELTFARQVKASLDQPIAIIKSAVGGTTIAFDWNPEGPEEGQKLYARTLTLIQDSLQELDRRKIPYELEAVIWHQGENDMLNRELNRLYAEGFRRFVASLRRDLEAPGLTWLVGEISDKGIWGMDHRENMQLLRRQQLEVVNSDGRMRWVPTSHLAFEVMGSGQPHYHFGTLGQLQHGEAYADAYLKLAQTGPAKNEPKGRSEPRIAKGKPMRVFLLMGQRNMEGEESFVEELRGQRKSSGLWKEQKGILYRYSLGGGASVSENWQWLGPANYLGYFGPELSFGAALDRSTRDNVAILKITDSAAVMLDWAPEGAEEESRPIYEKTLAFIDSALTDLANRGCEVTVEGVFWHQGEHDTYFGPYRPRYQGRLEALISQLRRDLNLRDLKWFVLGQSPRAPWGADRIAEINGKLAKLAEEDPFTWFVDTSHLPHGRIHFETEGTVLLGEEMARAYLATH